MVKKTEAFQKAAIVGLVLVVLATNEGYRRVRGVLDQVSTTATELRHLRLEVDALQAQIDATPGQQLPAMSTSMAREASYVPMPAPLSPLSLPLPIAGSKPTKGGIETKSSKTEDSRDTESIVLIGDAKAGPNAPAMNVSLLADKK